MGWIVPAITAASAIYGAYQSSKNKVGSQTVTQQPMRTPEEEEAMKRMLGFAKTGKYGNYEAGAQYGGDLGNYEMTGLEKQGQTSLQSLMNQAIGTQNFDDGLGKEKLNELLTGDEFDPYNEKGTYKGYKKQTLRELSEAQDRLKQNQAISGGLYSTATARESGLLQERGQDQLSNKLAELYQRYNDQKVGAIPLALQSDQFTDQAKMQEQQQNEGIAMGRINAASTVGATERLIKDMQAKDKYNEWMRANEDAKSPLKALESVYGNKADWGSPSMTTPGYQAASPWADVLNSALQFGITAYGQKKTPATDSNPTGTIPLGSKLSLY